MSDTPSCSRSGSHASSSTVPGLEKKDVCFNEKGQPIGPNSGSFATELGSLTRTHCPIYFERWRQVPNQAKVALWTRLQEMFTVTDACQKQVFRKSNDYWRDYKTKLRKMYIDPCTTNEERRRNCPKGLRPEDWERFLSVELTPNAVTRRVKGKALRSSMKAPHTTGRLGAARIAEQLRLRDPSRPVTRTNLYIATHSRKDGSCPTQELSSQMEQIKFITSSDPSSTSRDISRDPVAEICGPEARGRVRGMGSGISRRMLTSSAPVRERLQEEQSKVASLEVQFDQMKNDIDILKEQMLAQHEVHATTGNSTSGRGSTATPSSHLQSPPATPLSLMAQHCELLHSGRRVVGVGTLVRVDGGAPAIEGFQRIIVDRAYDPTSCLISPEADGVLGDMVGAVVLWPTQFIRMI